MEDGNPLIAILLTAILILINGMLASAEIAFVGLSEPKLRPRAESGDKKAKILLRMKQNPSSFLSAIQIGITLAGLLSGAFAVDSLSSALTGLAVQLGVSGFALSVIRVGSSAFITLLLTYFTILCGELVPKRMAMNNPEGVARKIVGPINLLSKITKPFVWLLATSTNAVLRLIGIDPDDNGEAVTEEDVMLLMQEGAMQGSIEDDELSFVRGVFEFGDLTAEDAMIHRTEIESVPLTASYEEVVAKMSQTGHSRFPVTDGNIDHIVGILYTQDLVRQALGKRDNPPSIHEVMRAPYFVPESKPLSKLFSDMKQSHHRMAVVVDEYGGTSGLITMMDLLEQIVGDIDPEEDDLVLLDDGSYRIDGRMDIDDAAEELGLNDLPEDCDTVGGLIVRTLGHIPEKGEHAHIEHSGYRFDVAEVEGSYIKTVLAHRLPENGAHPTEEAASPSK